jgi:hypothetical protein
MKKEKKKRSSDLVDVMQPWKEIDEEAVSSAKLRLGRSKCSSNGQAD